MKVLRRYQERGLQEFLNWANEKHEATNSLNDRLATIILATGLGKTFLATSCVGELYKAEHPQILWAAHREELIDQAYNEFKQTIPDAKIAKEMAENRAPSDSDIVVGSVQTLHRKRKNLNDFSPKYIIIDEWHHYHEKNSQYHGLIERYPNAKVLGLTATPYRFIGGDLPTGQKLIEVDIGTGVRHKYLVPPKPEIIYTDVSLADVKTRAGDFAIDELSKAVNVEARNKLIANRLIAAVKDEHRKGILFGVDVDHAKAMFQLIKKEVRAIEIYGETDKDERREAMERMRNGDVDVLVNNLVATEGFDVPHVNFICVARPTKSLGLHVQMIGRGLRLFEGKTDCLIIDVFDKVKVTQGRKSFADVASTGDLDGSRKRIDSILKEEFAKELKNFPVVIKVDENGRWIIDEEAWFAPAFTLAENQWVITWQKREERVETGNYIYVPLAYLPKSYSIRKNPIAVNHRFYGDGTLIDIENFSTAVVNFEKAGVRKLENWQDLSKREPEYIKRELKIPIRRIIYICMKQDKNYGRLISFEHTGSTYKIIEDTKGDSTTLNEIISAIAKQDDMHHIVNVSAQWRKRKASDKQTHIIRGYLKNNKITNDIDLTSITAGEASLLMEQVMWHDKLNNLFGGDKLEDLIGYKAVWDDV